MSSVRITTYRDLGSTPFASPALRERRAPSDEQEHDPFAPPPKGAPDRPWQPRRPPHDSDGNGGGQGGDQGDRWSSRQPERHDPSSGPFGTPPGGRPGQGPGGPGRSQGPRFDVTDPAQRRARYALLAGMWGLFFGLFSMEQVALLLGVLALYWGVSSLRAKPKPKAATDPAAAPQPTPPVDSPYLRVQQKPQFTAALSGIIAGTVALAIVGATFAFQLAYRDYYSCVNDALTQPARQACSNLLPQQLRPMLGAQN